MDLEILDKNSLARLRVRGPGVTPSHGQLFFVERLLDTHSSLVLAAVQAVGIDAEQDVNAVAGPLSDAFRFNACFEPGRNAGMP